MSTGAGSAGEATAAAEAAKEQVAAGAKGGEGGDGNDDDDDDAGSVLSDDSLTSIETSVVNFQVENGRTYHGFHRGKYLLPNDEQERDRLEIQHEMFYLMLDGRLCLCPKYDSEAKRVLDIGTGFGFWVADVPWAIDFADRHPEAQVIGVDLSPTQPGMVPPNCSFVIDDLDCEWTWKMPFDFIFGRCLSSSFEDITSIIEKSFFALEPGGYLELQDISFPVNCDDGTLKPDSPIFQWSRFLMLATEKVQRPITSLSKFKEIMEDIGFEDVVEKTFKWPFNSWPLDPACKKLGTFMKINTEVGLESISMAWFTRVLGWTRVETLNFCMLVRREMQDTKIHAYFPIYVVYGRKPLAKDKGKQPEVPEIKLQAPPS